MKNIGVAKSIQLQNGGIIDFVLKFSLKHESRFGYSIEIDLIQLKHDLESEYQCRHITDCTVFALFNFMAKTLLLIIFFRIIIGSMYK